MRLEWWIVEATQGFPLAVQERLAKECRAHWEQHLEAGESGEVKDILGDSANVRRELKRLYSSQEELTYFQETAPRFINFQNWYSLGFMPLIYIYMASIDFSKIENAIVATLSCLLAFTTFLFYQKIKLRNNSEQTYLKYFWLQWLTFANCAGMYANIFDLEKAIAIFLSISAILFFIWAIWSESHRYARLRRTLALKQP